MCSEAERSSGSSLPAPDYDAAIVKNTFIEVRDDDPHHPMRMRRANSEGRLSRSGSSASRPGQEQELSGSSRQDMPIYWLGSLSSRTQSSSASHQEGFKPMPLPFGGTSVPLTAWQMSALRDKGQPASRADSPKESQDGDGPPPGLGTSEPSELVLAMHAETGAAIAELQVIEKEGQLHQIPRNDQGELASVGSVKHDQNECSPCLFWFRKACAKGVTCDYCHFRHKGQRNKRIRPSKKTRMQMKASADADGRDSDGDLEPEAASFGLGRPGPAPEEQEAMRLQLMNMNLRGLNL